MVAVVLLAISTVAIASIGAGTPEPHVALTVRVYDAAGIPAEELVSARHAAEAILADTGMDVTFRHCGRPVIAEYGDDACAESLKPAEVVVRVIDAPAFNLALRPETYGLAYVVKETNRGWLATAFSDRVNEAAARVGADPGTLLGRVMAHEIGHLLLGTSYHGDAGVMRAYWPDAVLNHVGEQWRFSRLEAARMQQAAAIPF
jgi:hypothetical protein